MKTKIKAVKILAVLCLCFGAATLLLWRYAPAAAGETQDTAVYEITNIPVGEITAVGVTNGKASFGVMQQGGQPLEMVSNVKGSYDQAQLRALIYAACHLTGSRKNTDPDSWEAYGYGSPQAMVSLFKADGTTVNFAILTQNPIDQNYYVFSQDEQAVYLVSKKEAELFLREEKDFFNRSIFPVITAANYSGVESVKLEFGGHGRDYTLEQQGGVFRLTSPIVQRVPTSAVLQELLGYISALYSDEFIAENADLNQYGFDAYTLKISLIFEGQPYTALLLDQGGDTCLMANPDTGAVYRVTRSNLSLLTRDYLTLLDGAAYAYSIGDLRSVAVITGGQETLFELSGQGEALTAVSGSLRLNAAQVPQMMQAFSAKIQSEIPPDEPVQGQPVLTLSFTLQSGSIEQVEFIPKSKELCYVRINGVTNFTTSAAVIQQIRQAAGIE